MNENLETLINALSDFAQTAASKAKTIGTIAKSNINILGEQEKLKKAYADLGRLYYRDYITGEEPDDAEYLPLCSNITELVKSIQDLRESIDKAKAGPEKSEDDKKEPEQSEEELREELSDLDEELSELQDEINDLLEEQSTLIKAREELAVKLGGADDETPEKKDDAPEEKNDVLEGLITELKDLTVAPEEAEADEKPADDAE